LTTDPTNAELVRRLEEVVRSVERLASTMEASYVRKEVYEAKHEALRREQAAAIREVADDVVDIKRIREKDGDRWKQAMFAIGVQVVVLLIVGAFAVSNFMARTGN
jgi:hypothetical protein